MEHLTKKNVPTIDKLFGFEEWQNVERVQHFLQEGEDLLYLFPCNDLLLEGQMFAIGNLCGMVGVYQEHAIINKIQMNAVERSLLTLLILTIPLCTHQRTMQNICKLYIDREGTRESVGEEDCVDLLPNVITTCNKKLECLNLVITSIDEGYQLTAL